VRAHVFASRGRTQRKANREMVVRSSESAKPPSGGQSGGRCSGATTEAPVVRYSGAKVADRLTDGGRPAKPMSSMWLINGVWPALPYGRSVQLKPILTALDRAGRARPNRVLRTILDLGD
jgi:hypothetical protein